MTGAPLRGISVSNGEKVRETPEEGGSCGEKGLVRVAEPGRMAGGAVGATSSLPSDEKVAKLALCSPNLGTEQVLVSWDCHNKIL